MLIVEVLHLHNITLSKLLPFHDLHWWDVGHTDYSLELTAAIMTAFAGFGFICMPIFQLLCLSLLLYFSVYYSWPFSPLSYAEHFLILIYKRSLGLKNWGLWPAMLFSCTSSSSHTIWPEPHGEYFPHLPVLLNMWPLTL